MREDPNVWRRLKAKQSKPSSRPFAKSNKSSELRIGLMSAKGLLNLVQEAFNFKNTYGLHPYFEEFINDPISIVELNKMLEGVNDRLKIILWAKFERGMTFKDMTQYVISTRTGNPVTTSQVRSLFNQAMQTMRLPKQYEIFKSVLAPSCGKVTCDNDVIELSIGGA